MMLSVLFLALLFALTSYAASDPESVRLLHRIYHPSRPSEPFTDRGALLLYRSGSKSSNAIRSAGLVPHDAFQADVAALELTFQSIVDDLSTHDGMTPTKASQEVLYQLAMEHPGDTHHSQWHVSSVKACHLPHTTSHQLILHLSSNASAAPYALDYFVNPVPHDGSCPRLPRRKAPSKPDEAAGSLDVPRVSFANLARLNETATSVSIKSPRVPPLPTLKTPPPLTQEGRPVQAPQEKSFLQKYWIYIAVGLAAIALAPGPAEEEGQASGGGGQRR